MGSVIQLVAWMLAESGGAARLRAATIRVTVAALCLVLAGGLMLAALGCAVTALWIASLPALGPTGASLVVAAVLLAVALILTMAAWLVMRRKPHRAGAAASPQVLLSEAARLFNEHKSAVLLAAVIAGAAAANSSRRP
jgi:hypothetical protein